MTQTTSGPDIVDTRIVFRVYAGLMALAGLAVAADHITGITADLLPRGPGKTACVALSAVFCLFAACVSVGLSHVEQPSSRHRALFWFAIGNTVAVFGYGVVIAALGGDNATFSLNAWGIGFGVGIGVTMLLFYFWQTGDGHRSGEMQALTRLFTADTPSAERIQSAYDEQIRAAASQEERHRLARDLHDSIKQQIFAMQTAAATAQARFDQDDAGAKEALERVREAAREAMAEMEAMLDNLRAVPVENLGLVEALKRQVESVGFRTGARVTLEVGPLPPSESLPANAQQAIFRVAQEALSNVARHARASAVRVALTADTWRVLLQVQDDGKGFDQAPAASGMGLANMRERAAAFGGGLHIDSTPGAGTRLSLSIPYASWASGGLAEYRQRVKLWLFVTVGNALLVAVIARQQTVLLFFGPTLAFAVILARTVSGYFRARGLAEESRWIESPSHS